MTEHLQTNDRPNIQTYALCTFTFSLQTFTIFFRINAFIDVYYNFLTFITSMLLCTVNRDDYGNGILIPIGNPKRMGMGRNGITMYGNGNGPYSHGNKFLSVDAVFSLCNSNVQFII